MHPQRDILPHRQDPWPGIAFALGVNDCGEKKMLGSIFRVITRHSIVSWLASWNPQTHRTE